MIGFTKRWNWPGGCGSIRGVITVKTFEERMTFMSRVTELLVNGKSRRVDADGERSLLSVMCDDLELTGNKFFARAAAADCNRHRRW